MLLLFMSICFFVCILFYIKMILYFISSKTTYSYPPGKVLQKRAVAMGGAGTFFLLIGIIIYLFSS